MMRADRKHRNGERTYSGRDVRQGEIILRTPLRKAIFIAGLVGFVIFSAILAASCVPAPMQ